MLQGTKWTDGTTMTKGGSCLERSGRDLLRRETQHWERRLDSASAPSHSFFHLSQVPARAPFALLLLPSYLFSSRQHPFSLSFLLPASRQGFYASRSSPRPKLAKTLNITMALEPLLSTRAQRAFMLTRTLLIVQIHGRFNLTVCPDIMQLSYVG